MQLSLEVARMNIAAPLIVSAVWMFLFRKVPSWSWFSRLLDRFPSPLKDLWAVWTDCTFCGGFWIALLVRWVAGMNFLTFQMELWPPIDWALDALTTGLAALFIIRVLDALKAVCPKH